MIITISGDPGSGKSSVAKAVAKKLGYNHYSGGDMRGLLAKEHGMTIDQLNAVGEKEDWTDRGVDEQIGKLSKREDNFVIDSRLAFHFIPQSVKIYLSANVKVAAERIYKDTLIKDTDRSDEPKYKNAEEVERYLRERVASDKKRYKKYYGLDHTDPKHYDLVLDTTRLSLEESIEKVLMFVKGKAA